MRLDDLSYRELLELPADGGPIRFAERRVVLMDTVALGLLRRELVEQLGLGAARGILTRLGYAHGYRTAEANRSLPWDTEDEWRRAGGRFHRLQGLVWFEPVAHPSSPTAFAEGVWTESYEAEQHLMHLGMSEEPVCWSLTGFASGYLTFAHGEPIYAVETKCVAKGDAVCTMLARRLATAGDELATELSYYEEDCLGESLRRAAQKLRRLERLSRRRLPLDRGVPEEGPDGCIAFSDAMRRTLALARQAARVEVPVLVQGETGVGKERIAKLVHDESSRSAGPFVAVNCGAIAPQLVESELFGHVRGAFTGAVTSRVGLFEAAARGTLLLDEVGELALEAQAKLLRVLQEGELRRVGEDRIRKVDVRVVAATHRDLRDEVRHGRFREDLYYRLDVIRIDVAPLRERRADVLPLARHFLEQISSRSRTEARELTPSAADVLLRYRWPGNVRELQNAMERAAVVAHGPRVDAGDLPEEVRRSDLSSRSGTTLRDVERSHVLAALAAHGGHRKKAARALGIGEATLYRKLRKYGQ